jgi:hypothetical protein
MQLLQLKYSRFSNHDENEIDNMQRGKIAACRQLILSKCTNYIVKNIKTNYDN